MKRDFNTVLKTLEGETFKDGQPKYARTEAGEVKIGTDGQPVVLEPAKDLTLRTVALNAIGGVQDGDQHMSGDEKFNLYKTAQKIVDACAKGEPAEISASEIVQLKNRIAKAWSVFVIGAAFSLLEE